MKKDENGLIDFSALDPDVSGAISQGRKRAAGRALTPAQRRRAGREANRVRITIDVPSQEYKDYLESWAENLSVSLSSLLIYLIAVGSFTATDEQLREHRVPTRSMRYDYLLSLPENYKPNK